MTIEAFSTIAAFLESPYGIIIVRIVIVSFIGASIGRWIFSVAKIFEIQARNDRSRRMMEQVADSIAYPMNLVASFIVSKWLYPSSGFYESIGFGLLAAFLHWLFFSEMGIATLKKSINMLGKAITLFKKLIPWKK